jgi:OOP family OmpA-OmpF porin
MRRIGIGGPLLVALLATAPAKAQSTGFALNRFDPSERGSDWFAAESLDLRGNNRLALGLVGDWAYKPLSVYEKESGDEVGAIVKNQLFAHLGGSFILADRLRFGLNLPVALANQAGDMPGGGHSTLDAGANLGDMRVGADVRLVGTYGDPFTFAGGVQVHVPTGSREAFTGDGKVRIVPRLLIAGDVDEFTYAARMGMQIRTQNENFEGQPFGSEIQFTAAAGVRTFDKRLTLGPEIFGSTVVSDGGDGFFDRTSTPFELLFGGHYQVGEDWRIGAGVGPGLTRGFGAPKFRSLISVEYAPGVKQPEPEPVVEDRDGDGIPDAQDACPDEPGIRTDDPRTNGCPPPPSDRDGDGVFDVDDACPDTPGVKTDDPRTNGCPPDRDKDGILDAEDACPDEPGIRTDDPATHGCPPPKDRDRDTILDDDDACPDDYGPADPDPKKHGCPRAIVTATEIKIFERVEFDYNRATIRPESDAVLTAVLNIMQKYPDIKRVLVEGHTDSRGSAVYNKGLSQRRADSVMKWLTSKGVEAARLSAVGFGMERPIATNDTDEGRQTNRRVQFIILERDKSDTKVEPAGGGR